MIPNKINIGGIDYKIIIHSDENPLDKKLIGRVDFIKETIYIEGSYSFKQQERILLHEMIHVIDEDNELGLSEETIKRLACNLYPLIKEFE